MVCSLFVFFFSSRRRHTRYIGDWSSDVCSSDLRRENEKGADCTPESQVSGGRTGWSSESPTPTATGRGRRPSRWRSEERRVGKECRRRGAPDGENRNKGTQHAHDRLRRGLRRRR